MTYVLALTGGIATGKSTADQFFKNKNIPVIDCDQIAHDLMKPQNASWLAIKEHFGPAYLNADQTINRKKLGQLVFSNQNALDQLNQLTHPLIFAKTIQKIKEYQKQKLVILDAPVYFESGMDKKKLADGVLVITLPQKMQLARLKKRNGLTDKEARIRIDSQMSLAKKAEMADFVIENTGTIKELEKKLEQLLIKIKEEG
ncbi:dephospho-CoA kinase [Lactobacillus ultunensis]|uniref:Dephospho-CoA kinase n=1 Tax=Lactobacillus ultunensis DSM 16047 TaxID=525365 RepID=C2EL12_9LACO|nr:dephospho-CoA kinase [Lactobacillus ultunensis]EEJ72758.1 dephospho-CoA kinase [Lactobacillus ultunensis DSM 16047]KRL83042.1 dephospho-coa kinase [Lactobacillus ultunensis DSM 16047]QQP29113.1 dephospho-CoA kinase [Lactobacillus ultunensis]